MAPYAPIQIPEIPAVFDHKKLDVLLESLGRDHYDLIEAA